MSLTSRSKKVSAFAVFKGRKAASMTDVSSDPDFDDKTGKPKSSSASTTPTRSNKDSSFASLVAKLTPSADKRKQKTEMKKLKKLLKNSNSKQRPSFLPDSALQSPLAELGNSSVKLKSLRPKGSVANMNYSLPLRANFVPKTPESTPIRQSVHVDGTPSMSVRSGRTETTPPLPPRQGFTRSSSRSSQNDVSPATRSSRGSTQADESVPPLPPRQAVKRGPTRGGAGQLNGTIPTMPPRPGAGQRTHSDDTDGAPTRPPKRRKTGQASPSGSQHSSFTKDFNESYASVNVPVKASVGSVHGEERSEPLPAHPAAADSEQPYMANSFADAAKLFECLIHPVKPQKFFSELWERKPLLVKRHMPSYNDGWFSTAELDRILRDHRIMFTENIDVTTYDDGQRETHNPVGRAFAPVVWDYYQNGCSVRMLNPQTYSWNVWKLLSILQEYFGSCTGANTYLTPPGTQGFAPHYDDIEAFIVQLEGKKHWRLYSPRNEGEALPRYSSGNFAQDEIGEPILDVILEAGDLLYFPRGTIHQGQSLPDAHSLHITVSCCQKNTWADFFEKLIPTALEIASQEDVEFRKALPKDYLNYMGMAFSDSDSPARTAFLKKVEQLTMKLLSHAPVDGAADQMGKRFLHDTLPPVFTEDEMQRSIHGSGEHWSRKDGRVRGATELEPDTPVKLIRKGVIRLVSEEDKVCVYHNLENTRIYHQVDPQCIEITEEMAPAVEFLLHSYPDYVIIDNFPLPSVDDKMTLAAAMYEKGMLVTEQPLEPTSDGSSEEE